jgi:hypothetical protein
MLPQVPHASPIIKLLATPEADDADADAEDDGTGSPGAARRRSRRMSVCLNSASILKPIAHPPAAARLLSVYLSASFLQPFSHPPAAATRRVPGAFRNSGPCNFIPHPSRGAQRVLVDGASAARTPRFPLRRSSLFSPGSAAVAHALRGPRRRTATEPPPPAAPRQHRSGGRRKSAPPVACLAHSLGSEARSVCPPGALPACCT